MEETIKQSVEQTVKMMETLFSSAENAQKKSQQVSKATVLEKSGTMGQLNDYKNYVSQEDATRAERDINKTNIQAKNISPELLKLQNYLTLLRTFKDEIKFAYELQQNLRKERAKFFSQTLREVSATLAQAQVDESIASMWVQDLVKSYTSSLDLSANLVDENTMNTISQIRASAKGHASDVSLNTQQNEPY
ncbi:hypothetical protein [Conchiformibius steedae]|nr:hypothetical protein [Conchiformibius steedae]